MDIDFSSWLLRAGFVELLVLVAAVVAVAVVPVLLPVAVVE
jgi:hypothetical protein